jgi:hypothetical protein
MIIMTNRFCLVARDGLGTGTDHWVGGLSGLAGEGH